MTFENRFDNKQTQNAGADTAVKETEKLTTGVGATIGVPRPDTMDDTIDRIVKQEKAQGLFKDVFGFWDSMKNSQITKVMETALDLPYKATEIAGRIGEEYVPDAIETANNMRKEYNEFKAGKTSEFETLPFRIYETIDKQAQRKDELFKAIDAMEAERLKDSDELPLRGANLKVAGTALNGFTTSFRVGEEMFMSLLATISPETLDQMAIQDMQKLAESDLGQELAKNIKEYKADWETAKNATPYNKVALGFVEEGLALVEFLAGYATLKTTSGLKKTVEGGVTVGVEGARKGLDEDMLLTEDVIEGPTGPEKAFEEKKQEAITEMKEILKKEEDKIEQLNNNNKSKIYGKSPTSFADFLIKKKLEYANIEMQLITALKETDTPTFDKYMEQAHLANQDFRNETPLGLAGDRAQEVVNTISHKKHQLYLKKKSLLDEYGDTYIATSELNADINEFLAEYNIELSVGDEGEIILNTMEGKTLGLPKKQLTELQELIDDIGGEIIMADSVTADNLDTIVDRLQSLVNYNKLEKGGATQLEAKFATLIGKFNERLKESLPDEYRELNKQYSEYASLQEDLRRVLGVEGEKGDALMKTVFSPQTGKRTRMLFERVKELTGVDLVNEASMAKFAMTAVGDTRQANLLRALDLGEGYSMEGKVQLAKALSAWAGKKFVDPAKVARKITKDFPVYSKIEKLPDNMEKADTEAVRTLSVEIIDSIGADIPKEHRDFAIDIMEDGLKVYGNRTGKNLNKIFKLIENETGYRPVYISEEVFKQVGATISAGTVDLSKTRYSTPDELMQDITYYNDKFKDLGINVNIENLGEKLLDERGQEMLGYYSGGEIGVGRGVDTTIAHEFAHGYMDLALSKKDKDTLFAEVQDRYVFEGDTEEYIADNIAKILQGDRTFVGRLSNDVKLIFNRLVNFVRGVFGKKQGVYEQFIKDVRQGKVYKTYEATEDFKKQLVHFSDLKIKTTDALEEIVETTGRRSFSRQELINLGGVGQFKKGKESFGQLGTRIDKTIITKILDVYPDKNKITVEEINAVLNNYVLQLEVGGEDKYWAHHGLKAVGLDPSKGRTLLYYSDAKTSPSGHFPDSPHKGNIFGHIRIYVDPETDISRIVELQSDFFQQTKYELPAKVLPPKKINELSVEQFRKELYTGIFQSVVDEKLVDEAIKAFEEDDFFITEFSRYKYDAEAGKNIPLEIDGKKILTHLRFIKSPKIRKYFIDKYVSYREQNAEFKDIMLFELEQLYTLENLDGVLEYYLKQLPDKLEGSYDQYYASASIGTLNKLDDNAKKILAKLDTDRFFSGLMNLVKKEDPNLELFDYMFKDYFAERNISYLDLLRKSKSPEIKDRIFKRIEQDIYNDKYNVYQIESMLSDVTYKNVVKLYKLLEEKDRLMQAPLFDAVRTTKDKKAQEFLYEKLTNNYTQPVPFSLSGLSSIDNPKIQRHIFLESNLDAPDLLHKIHLHNNLDLDILLELQKNPYYKEVVEKKLLNHKDIDIKLREQIAEDIYQRDFKDAIEQNAYISMPTEQILEQGGEGTELLFKKILQTEKGEAWLKNKKVRIFSSQGDEVTEFVYDKIKEWFEEPVEMFAFKGKETEILLDNYVDKALLDGKKGIELPLSRTVAHIEGFIGAKPIYKFVPARYDDAGDLIEAPKAEVDVEGKIHTFPVTKLGGEGKDAWFEIKYQGTTHRFYQDFPEDLPTEYNVSKHFGLLKTQQAILQKYEKDILPTADKWAKRKGLETEIITDENGFQYFRINFDDKFKETRNLWNMIGVEGSFINFKGKEYLNLGDLSVSYDNPLIGGGERYVAKDLIQEYDLTLEGQIKEEQERVDKLLSEYKGLRGKTIEDLDADLEVMRKDGWGYFEIQKSPERRLRTGLSQIEAYKGDDKELIEDMLEEVRRSVEMDEDDFLSGKEKGEGVYYDKDEQKAYYFPLDKTVTKSFFADPKK